MTVLRSSDLTHNPSSTDGRTNESKNGDKTETGNRCSGVFFFLFIYMGVQPTEPKLV